MSRHPTLPTPLDGDWSDRVASGSVHGNLTSFWFVMRTTDRIG
jgi:hypothetical protein